MEQSRIRYKHLLYYELKKINAVPISNGARLTMHLLIIFIMALHPDKLYNCIMVHDFNEYWFKAMDKEKPYYFSIEAINENGVSERTKVIRS